MYKIQDKLFIGVDPGMNGGIAFIRPEMETDYVRVERCPKTVHEMATLFEMGVNMAESRENVVVFIEHVWTFPGDG